MGYWDKHEPILTPKTAFDLIIRIIQKDGRDNDKTLAIIEEICEGILYGREEAKEFYGGVYKQMRCEEMKI